MKCKILHLPTGTLMWYDIKLHNQKDYAYFYTNHEKEITYKDENNCMSTTFPSKKEAMEYLMLWCSSNNRTTALEFSKDQHKNYRVLIEHFEILGVK